VLTTHYLDEADSMAERGHRHRPRPDHRRRQPGEADDSPEKLKAEHVGARITFGFLDAADAVRAAARIPHRTRQDGAALVISVADAPHLIPRLLDGLRTDGLSGLCRAASSCRACSARR
jgi:ABC-2 type transport system ATP-binding protein